MITIEGVPESISREDFTTMIRSLGIDPDDVVDMKFMQSGIYAKVLAKNEDGSRYLTSDNTVAAHQIYIKVTDD